jgi:hypothetical protein
MTDRVTWSIILFRLLFGPFQCTNWRFDHPDDIHLLFYGAHDSVLRAADQTDGSDEKYGMLDRCGADRPKWLVCLFAVKKHPSGGAPRIAGALPLR